MSVARKHGHLKRDFLIVVVFTIACTTVMVLLDVFNWIHVHSRQFGQYHLHEIAYFFFLFSSLGAVWLIYRQYRYVILNKINGRLAAAGPRNVSDIFFNSLAKFGILVPSHYRSPFLLVLFMYLIIITIETLDMFLLHYVSNLPIYIEAFIDSLFLAFAISPAFYYLILRPMLQQASIRDKAEKDLQELNDELEIRIEQRTNQLQTELAERWRAETILVEQQKKLMELSSELTLVAEQERSNIAANLHDNIGHNLALVKNKLALVRKSLSKGIEPGGLDDVDALIESTIRYIRALNFELSAPVFYDIPFRASLEWMLEEVLDSHNIAYRLDIDECVDQPPDDARTILLRSIRELLVNIVKHSKASCVEMTVQTENNEMIITVDDDGTGFDVSEDFTSQTGRQGIGLFTVRERMNRLGGRFSIVSGRGEGTRALLAVPHEAFREDG